VHEHGGLLDIEWISSIGELIQGGIVEVGELGIIGITVLVGFTDVASVATLRFTLKWHATILRMDGSVMAEE
jgi:hypothetical protein